MNKEKLFPALHVAEEATLRPQEPKPQLRKKVLNNNGLESNSCMWEKSWDDFQEE